MLRKQLDKLAPLFEKGGKFEKLYPIYEATDTILFTPGEVTKTASHVRDGLDQKRMMFTVVIALIPCILMAMYNTGYQAHLAVSHRGRRAPLERGTSRREVWQNCPQQRSARHRASACRYGSATPRGEGLVAIHSYHSLLELSCEIGRCALRKRA